MSVVNVYRINLETVLPLDPRPTDCAVALSPNILYLQFAVFFDETFLGIFTILHCVKVGTGGVQI